MIILCLKCKKHLSGMGCRVAYINLEAYMRYINLEAYLRLSENWYDILCFPYHSYIHYHQCVLLTSCKVVKTGQLCHVMQVCVCEQHLGWLTELENFLSHSPTFSYMWFINLVFRVESKYVPYSQMYCIYQNATLGFSRKFSA
jgi:hypothetical protein